MFDHRLWRWPNIDPTQDPVFAGLMLTLGVVYISYLGSVPPFTQPPIGVVISSTARMLEIETEDKSRSKHTVFIVKYKKKTIQRCQMNSNRAK